MLADYFTDHDDSLQACYHGVFEAEIDLRRPSPPKSAATLGRRAGSTSSTRASEW